MTSKIRDILELLEHSRPAHCELLVAGGACRDILVGVEPKDYDVLVDIRDYSYEAAFTYMSRWASNMRTSGIGVDVYEAYGHVSNPENHFNRMYNLCAKVVLLDGTLLDLLFVKETLLGTVASFDSNVNRVYYDVATGRIERLGLPPEEGFFVANNLPAGRADKAFRHWQKHYQEGTSNDSSD